MRRLYIIGIFFCSSLISFSQEYNPNVETIINEVNLDSLMFYMRNLSGEDSVVIAGETTRIEHRVSNWGNDLAADYIKQTLEGFGLATFVQDYSSGGKNVYAIQEGIEYPNEYYMICAHYDAVDYYCADDNASGSSAVLEAARIFSEMEFEYSIIFALWDEEEIGLVGSDYYASQAASNGDVIHAVINMDMISWDNDDDMVAEIHSSLQANSNDLSDYIIEINTLYNLDLSPIVQIPGTTASDHSRFWNNGYAAVLMIEEYYGGDFNPYYHTEEDRIGILNMPYFHEMAKLSLGALASMVEPLVESAIDELGQFSAMEISAYPNPFHSATTISYVLKGESYIRMSLVNSQGKEIKLLVEGIKQPGENDLQLQNENLPAGLYFLCTQTSTDTYSHKLLVN